MRQLILFLISFLSVLDVSAQQPVPQRPRILISTDIGGTDPDDNQSMMHFLLYCNKFRCRGHRLLSVVWLWPQVGDHADDRPL